MDNSSGLFIARRVVSVALIVLTALAALLWAWPKFGDGGFIWTLSVPVGVGFAYLVHLLTAPRRRRRSVWVPIGITSALTMLWSGGLIVATLPMPTDPTETPSNQLMLVFTIMMLWPFLMGGGLTLILILKLAARAGNRAPKHEVPAGPFSSVPAMPASQNSPSFISGSSPPTALVPVHNSFTPAVPSEPRMPATASAAPQPKLESSDEFRPALTSADESSTALRPASGVGARTDTRPAATDIPLHDLSTLTEIAVSLGADDASSALTLEFGDDGITVAADGVPLGAVEGSWTGSAPASATVLAADLLHGLRSFDAPVSQLTIIPSSTSTSDMECRAMGSDQRFSIRSVTV